MVDVSDHDYSHFDTLIAQNGIFAAYRVPGSSVIKFIIQESGEPSCFHKISSLNGKEGFVVAPFSTDKGKPVVLFRPDIILEGEDEMFDYLNNRVQKGTTFSNTKQNISLPSENDNFARYKQAFHTLQSSLLAGKCEKVVLSRKISKTIPEDFSAGKIFHSALKAYPEAFVCIFGSPQTGTWIVCSPELILSGKGKDWQTVSLAGTMSATDNMAEILWDQKNINEQEIVSSYIEKQLMSKNIDFTKKGPYTIIAGKLIHLKTDYSLKLNDEGITGDLLESLHPTPAVCGYPGNRALKLIQGLEGYDRGYYSGFSGPLSLKGETCLFVNLRCMEIASDSLNLYAGGGLLPSSELLSEWEETEAKLQTMLSLIES